MRNTLSMLYQLQVLSDQLMSTNKKRHELKMLREQNNYDYNALGTLLTQQTVGLDEALRLKSVIYRDMKRSSEQIHKIKKHQTEIQARIDYRREVMLDKQMTNHQNTLHIKFKELNQLLWQLGEPLRHPTYLKAHLTGLEDIIKLLDIERILQISFAGYNIDDLIAVKNQSLIEYITSLCKEAAGCLKKIGGSSRYHTFLSLSESECRRLFDNNYDTLIEEDLKVVESKAMTGESKRASRERIQRIQLSFNAVAKSFTKLSKSDLRPKNYDQLLLECVDKSYDEIKEILEPLIPLSVDGKPSTEDEVISDQFKVDYAINPKGFLHIFQEKFDRLKLLRVRMDKVEELQERELKTEEAKVLLKLAVQDKIRDKLRRTHVKQLRIFEQIAAAREHHAVAYVKRSKTQGQSGFCSGCKVVVPKSLNQKVRRLEKMQRCHSCHRILVPFAHITYVKEEVDPLLVSEEERIIMEEEGMIGLIPACSNCGNELYFDKETKKEIEPTQDLKTICAHCYSYLVPLEFEERDLYSNGEEV